MEGNYPNIFLIKTETQLGTGFLINSQGYILTAKHLFKNTDNSNAECSNHKYSDKPITAKLIDADDDLDFALLKVIDEDIERLPDPIKYIIPKDLTEFENKEVFGYGYGQALKSEHKNNFDLEMFAGKVALGQNPKINKHDERTVLHKGDSGSPLMIRKNEQTLAFGIIIKDEYIESYTDIHSGYFLPFYKITKQLNEYFDFEGRREKKSTTFRYLGSAKSLQANDILENARLNEKSLKKYYRRDFVDDNLEFNLKNNKHIIIVGQSLAGKTRAVYELLKKDEFSDYNIIFPYSTALADIENLEKYTKGNKNILFLDDIDDYILYNKENKLEKILQQAFNPNSNTQIIATCKTGIDEFAVYDEKISQKLKENFTEIFIPKIDDADIPEIEKQLNISIERDDFDHNIGSAFLDLSVMKERYKKLSETEKRILLALKIYFLLAYKEKFGLYSLEKIQYLFKKLNNGYNENSFKESLDKIRDQKDKLNFVYLYDEFIEQDFDLEGEDTQDLYIDCEDAYIQKIIKPEFDFFKAIKKVFKTFNQEELNKYGFTNLNIKLNIYLNSLTDKNLSEQEFNEILKKVKSVTQNVEINEYTVAILIKLAGENTSLQKEIITEYPHLLNEVSYNTLISKAPDYKTSLEWFNKMIEKNIKLDEVSYNTLISKAPDYKTSLEWFNKMIEKNIKPNEVSYSTLISKAPDYKTSLEWFNKMIEKNIKPNEVSYNTLISKAPNKEEAKKWLLEMKNKKIRPNNFTFFLYVNNFSRQEQGSTKGQKQKELIQEFLQIFKPGKDFGVREFRRLRMHPAPILLFAEEIYKIAPHQKRLICMLLDKILQNPKAKKFFKNKAKEMQNMVNRKF